MYSGGLLLVSSAIMPPSMRRGSRLWREHVPQAELIHCSDRRRTSLLRINVERVRTQIMQHPWIGSVGATRPTPMSWRLSFTKGVRWPSREREGYLIDVRGIS